MPIPSTLQRPNRVALGVLLIVGSVFLMSLQDAIVKLASTDLNLWQIYVLRSLLSLPILLILSHLQGNRDWPKFGAIGWVALRSALLVLMYICIYAAVPVLSLSVIGAAFYTGPLFITLFSALLIGEPVSRRGWFSVFLGFAGVLVILRPGTESFAVLTLLPVLSGLFYALAAITTRSKCLEESSLSLAVGLNMALLVTGLIASGTILLWQPAPQQSGIYPFLLNEWTTMTPPNWMFVAVLALMIVGIGIGLAKAYQSAPPAIIATFDYSYLVFAAFWSFALFADPPDTPTVIGMILIAGAGVYLLYQATGKEGERKKVSNA